MRVLLLEDELMLQSAITEYLTDIGYEVDAFDSTQLQVVTIKNRGHIDISSDTKYYKIMQNFIDE